MKKRYFFLIYLWLFLALFTGFIYYANNICKPQQHLPPEAIIVLTGGHNRLPYGVRLLREYPTTRMLVSGVNQNLTDAAIIHALKLKQQDLINRIDIGRSALNTAGNAVETAAWVNEHHYQSLYVVTNDYHMPRALLELKMCLPKTKLIPAPVYDKEVNINRFVLFFLEFFKYIRANIKYYFLHLVSR